MSSLKPDACSQQLLPTCLRAGMPGRGHQWWLLLDPCARPPLGEATVACSAGVAGTEPSGGTGAAATTARQEGPRLGRVLPSCRLRSARARSPERGALHGAAGDNGTGRGRSYGGALGARVAARRRSGGHGPRLAGTGTGQSVPGATRPAHTGRAHEARRKMATAPTGAPCRRMRRAAPPARAEVL